MPQDLWSYFPLQEKRKVRKNNITKSPMSPCCIIQQVLSSIRQGSIQFFSGGLNPRLFLSLIKTTVETSEEQTATHCNRSNQFKASLIGFASIKKPRKKRFYPLVRGSLFSPPSCALKVSEFSVCEACGNIFPQNLQAFS